jgi:aspartokinase/homoserine dehydrogenase 1
LKEQTRLKLNVVGIACSRNALFNRDGLDLTNYREELKKSVPSNNIKLRDEIIGMNIFNSVFVDCTASKDIAELYQSFLEHNISIIAANKIAASSKYENYLKLKHTALARGVKFRFETNVGAGLPIIGTINDLRNSGDKILKIEAVLSGTLNYIFNETITNHDFLADRS